MDPVLLFVEEVAVTAFDVWIEAVEVFPPTSVFLVANIVVEVVVVVVLCVTSSLC